MDWTFLLKPDGPHHHVIHSHRDTLSNAIQGLGKLRDRGLVARWLRGSKMRTTQGLFDEWAAALQFPPYFGENWDAFDECLNDLEWLHGECAALILLDAEELLQDADPAEARILFDILSAEQSDLPFHVIYQTEEGLESLLDGLKALGVTADLRTL